MKIYLILGFTCAISVQLSGMFLDIDDISRSRNMMKDKDKYSETVSVIKEGPDTTNFAFSLSGRIPGYFGERKVPFAKVIITISESPDKNKAINKIYISFDQSTDLARKKENKEFAESWSEKRKNFSELFFGKNAEQLDKKFAESQAKIFYRKLADIEEDSEFNIDEFIDTLTKSLTIDIVSLAPKLEELAHALITLR